jgi:multidrug efflux pump subunit AcrA (membrane-fusion protein)
VDGGKGVVFVYAGDHAERRAVVLGPAAGADRQILSGIREGERVVLSPPESLRDGDRITLAEDRSGPAQ